MGHINFSTRFPDAFVRYESGTILAEQGQKPDAMYILIRGTVEVRVDGRPVALIKEAGSYVGEIAFILDRPSSADCVVARKASLLRITHDQAPELIRSSPQIAIKLARHMARRIAAVEDRRVSWLDTVQTRTTSALEHIKYRGDSREWIVDPERIEANRMRLDPGEMLISEGMPSLYLFVLVEGEIGVKRRNQEIARLSRPGTILGEVALLLDSMHIASCEALTPVVVARLHRDRVFQLFRSKPEFAMAFLMEITRRLLQCNASYSRLEETYAVAAAATAAAELEEAAAS